MTLDAHQHFWQYDPQRHAWIDETMHAIQRSFMPDDLQPLLQANGVEGTILVQVEQTLAENTFFLELASRFHWIKGVVGWIDLQAAEIEAQLAALSVYPLLKGFRHIAQGEPDPHFLVRKEVVRGIKALGKAGFTYDILIYPHQMEAAIGLVAQCPDQPFVLDHLGKPYIRTGDIDGWRKDISRLSANENVWVKLSGLVTEADWNTWQPADIFPYLEVALECFGPKRLMWGSDWPVCLVAADYGRVLQLVRDFILPLSPSEQQGIMGDNCAAFYKCVPVRAAGI